MTWHLGNATCTLQLWKLLLNHVSCAHLSKYGKTFKNMSINDQSKYLFVNVIKKINLCLFVNTFLVFKLLTLLIDEILHICTSFSRQVSMTCDKISECQCDGLCVLIYLAKLIIPLIHLSFISNLHRMFYMAHQTGVLCCIECTWANTFSTIKREELYLL